MLNQTKAIARNVFMFALATLTLNVQASGPNLPSALQPAAAERPTYSFRLDVVQNATEFFFEGAVNENGIPAKGTPFVTTGYIYPGGTLATYGTNRGITAAGDAEFPDLVLGTWTCRGWHLQDGDAETGVVVVTTQTFDFDIENAGLHMIVTDGIELADFNVPFVRPITGGSGKFGRSSGQMRQTYLNFNESGGFNMSFETKVH